jgi:hypothetical protein
MEVEPMVRKLSFATSAALIASAILGTTLALADGWSSIAALLPH